MRRFRLALVGLVAVTAFLLAAGSFPAPASAANFTVDSTADATDAIPGDAACDDGAGNCTLRAAIQEANAAAGGAHTITVPSGTYTLTIAGTGEDAAATGDLDFTGDLTITGAGAATTIIQACDSSAAPCTGVDRVFHITAWEPYVDISGVTIQNGWTTGSPGEAFGGGINNVCGYLTLTDSIVRANTTIEGGGGISSYCDIDPDAGSFTLTNVTVKDNQASGSGGGIYNESYLSTIANSTISGNAAGANGGGMYNMYTKSYPTIITNSTISGNAAVGHGGGIYNESGVGVLNLNNVTITDNTADSVATGARDGGGVAHSSGTVNFKNTIIAGNTDNSPGAEAPDCSGILNSQDYNLIQNTAGCTITGTTTHNITGVSANLGPLADNGGVTFTHALLAGSPAIDAGSPTTCEATDQRGAARPQGAACDIGAYEDASTATCQKFPPGETHVVDLQLCFDDIRLDLDQDPNCTLEYSSGPVCFTGPGTIWRSDPYRSGGYCTIDKKMKSASLTATLAGHLTTMIFGSEQGLPESTGQIVSTSPVPGEEFPAVNDWEVHFKIGGLPTGELQNCDLDLDGTPDPATLEAIIWTIPPYGALHLGSVDLGGVISACDGDGEVRAEGEDAKGEVSPPVGGVVETLDGSAGPDSSADSSSGSGFNHTALGGALAAAAVALAAGGWYARRRWAR